MMPLAPKPSVGNAPPGRKPNPAPGRRPNTRSKSSVASAEGKAAQRKRNKEAGFSTVSGSSGIALSVAKMPKRLWEDVENEVVHVCDVAGKISHSQVGASGFLVTTLNSPLEYAHDMLEAHLASKGQMVYIRVYAVDVAQYLGDYDDADSE